MTTIKTHCTIVNMKVEMDHWSTIPLDDGTLPAVFGRGGWYQKSDKITIDSGWTERAVVANLQAANRIWSVADVKSDLAGIKTIALAGYQKDGRVDRPTLELIAATIHARSFTPGIVHVAFIKSFTGPYRGRSVQEWCYACVFRPDSAEQGAWVLAHELGHLLGLGHDCGDTTRMMHYAWMHGIGKRISKEEIAVVKAHAHVDRSAVFVPPTESEPVCRS